MCPFAADAAGGVEGLVSGDQFWVVQVLNNHLENFEGELTNVRHCCWRLGLMRRVVMMLPSSSFELSADLDQKKYVCITGCALPSSLACGFGFVELDGEEICANEFGILWENIRWLDGSCRMFAPARSKLPSCVSTLKS